MKQDDTTIRSLMKQATHLITDDRTYYIDWCDEDFFQVTDEDNNTIQLCYSDIDIKNDMILKLLNP